MYAPVGIYTINRCDTLKKCIESLQANREALYTDLYISVDYPPNERYVDGNKEILEYLKNGLNGFKNVNVIYQNTNIGSSANARLLIDKMREQFAYGIILEDDIIVSSHFLQYMNDAFEAMKDSENVISISGYLAYRYNEFARLFFLDGYTSFALKSYGGWGTGVYFDRYIGFTDKICMESFGDIIKKKELCKKLKSESNFYYDVCIRTYLELMPVTILNGEVAHIDYTFGVMCKTYDYYEVVATRNLVNNIGMDERAEHCSKNNEKQLEIYNGALKEFRHYGNADYESLIDIDNSFRVLSKYRLLKDDILVLLIRILGKDRTVKIRTIYKKLTGRLRK